MEKILITLIFLITATESKSQELPLDLEFEDAIPVLNFGTFHMGYSPDASTTEFDEHNPQMVREVHKVARAIAAFRPTVILVERLPEKNSLLQKAYQEYLKDPDMTFEHPSEIELLAFEVGRLAGTQRIYGIDHSQGYNYRIAGQVKNSLDSKTYFRYMQRLEELSKQYPEEEMTLVDHLRMTNLPQYQDMLININADMLTHVSSAGNAEGAEEASKFYHRNLVMYSHLNQIELSGEDRVFILMGGTHTAFFKMWLERSPKYKVVEAGDYLK